MLILKRNLNQGILIGTNVRVIVAGFDGDKVRLGIEAPRELEIWREELVRRSRPTTKLDLYSRAIAVPDMLYTNDGRQLRVLAWRPEVTGSPDVTVGIQAGIDIGELRRSRDAS